MLNHFSSSFEISVVAFGFQSMFLIVAAVFLAIWERHFMFAVKMHHHLDWFSLE
jgi:hypothetical protein